MRRAPLLVALFLAAVSLRPQLVGVGTLLPSIQRDLGVSHAVAGLLGTIPVLCMGLFAPPAAFLSGRIGSRRAIGLALALIGVFGLARVLVPGAAGVILLTIPLGIGMGLAGAILPVAAKERFSDRPGFATGAYTTGITSGAAIAAAASVPLAHAAGGWRTPLLVFSAVACALTAIWFWLTRLDTPHVRSATRPLRLPWRNPLGWRLVAAFFFMSFVFYGLNSWLPDAYVERGWSQSSAGDLLAVLNTITIPVGFFAAWAADHIGTRRLWLGGAAALQVLSLLGVVLIPSAGWVWAVLLGMSIGPLFPLTMTLPLDAAARPAEVAALAGMMLGLGYTLSSTGPLILGAVRDLSGGFDAVLWVLVGASAFQFLVDASFSPARLAASRLRAVDSI
ncbi:MAG: transporter, family, cyanate transporter [Gaiellaceae bacterium]|nr:transporter, family, cyanate transporter [Gaiellaceae bacterium]